MGAAVAVLLIKERQIVEALQRAGITSAASARSIQEIEDLGVHSSGVAWYALKNRVIVREAAPGRFYVDVEVWQSTRRRRRRVMFLLLAVVLLAAVVTLLNAHRFAQ